MDAPDGLPPGVPPELAAALAGSTVHPVDDGRARAEVWRVEHPDRGRRYLKRTAPADAADPWEGGTAVEAERLRWLAGRVAVPSVVAHATATDGSGWLLTEALGGADATDPVHHGAPERLVTALAQGLRRFHEALSIDACPFDTRLDVRLAAARQRIAAGRVDADDFDPLHRGQTPDDLLAVIEALRPPGDEDLVVVHGDYSFPNVILDRGEVIGYVDLGRCGVADRYLDLAVAATSIARNLGGHAVGPFFEAYGIEWPDVVKLELYVLLDELF
ncbi:MAG TPA: APH(3') family aminoglycoside O-phosphotransferase [Acidimicrobiales bacterium]|nr:APH(3') family aminoglycoside O-phosphotransferase [Acidimicrobiales bacterium]